MKTDSKRNTTAEIMEWCGENRGDGIAIKSGLRIFTVDKYGTLISQRYKRSQAIPIHDGTQTSLVEGLTDLKIGDTYSISQSNIVIGKVLESTLFGYRFFAIGPQGEIGFIDMDYEDIIAHCQAGHVNRILLRNV